MTAPTIGWSDYAQKHARPGTGNSYTVLTDQELVETVQLHWDSRKPGAGETGIDRKVLVPVSRIINPNIREQEPPFDTPAFYCPPRMPLQAGMPIQARAKQRQEGEDPYLETFISTKDAVALGFEPTPAKRVNIVCYSADALEENNGHRTTNCDWEIVTIIAVPTTVDEDPGEEPMLPLAMARNFLEKPGGTKGVYSAREFAEAIYHHSQKGIRVADE